MHRPALAVTLILALFAAWPASARSAGRPMSSCGCPTPRPAGARLSAAQARPSVPHARPAPSSSPATSSGLHDTGSGTSQGGGGGGMGHQTNPNAMTGNSLPGGPVPSSTPNGHEITPLDRYELNHLDQERPSHIGR